ncbi:MAG: class I mannose-6-phosphate isomerase [Anaerohalosphaeraceae bacterium]|nr:class I mannose-6-phosphate isomerase [Anaerohalosphaeraceae bacterium]
MQLYPLKFQPVYKERIWGGQKLAKAFGKDIPQGQKIGESWELADLAEGKSMVKAGPLAGQTIAEIIERFGSKAVMGIENYSPPFPLLIKILDAEDVLSVQVHPDGPTCQRMGKGNLKTECWYIIAAESGACIYKGLKKGVTREQFAKAIADGNVEELLIKVLVNVGECHFLPAGTVHAIGAGLLIAEIQTPSDTTYRVFDWNRVDPASGKGRQLHIEDSLESIHFEHDPAALSVSDSGMLVDCEFFKVEKCVKTDGEVSFASGKMSVLMFIEGSGIISGPGEQTEFAKGDCLMLPAEIDCQMKCNDSCTYLNITI